MCAIHHLVVLSVTIAGLGFYLERQRRPGMVGGTDLPDRNGLPVSGEGFSEFPVKSAATGLPYTVLVKTPLLSSFTEAGELRSYIKERGLETIIFLHGFPDNVYSFTNQMRRLSEGGYACIAISLPGYEPATAAATTADANLLAVTDEVMQVVEAVVEGKVHLVGHDWGACIGEVAAAKYASRLATFTSLAVSVKGFVARSLSQPSQFLLSWYIIFNQLPFLPERFLARDTPGNLAGLLWSLWGGKPFSEARLRSVVGTLQKPGVAGAALAYYRQNLAGVIFTPLDARGLSAALAAQVTVPTLGIGGLDDGCIVPASFKAAFSRTYYYNAQVVMLKGVGHFLHHESPNEVSDLIENHIKRHKTGAKA